MKKVMKRKAHREGTGKRTVQFRSRVSEKARRGIKAERLPTSDVTYEIVQHDGGWAYKVDGVFSEAFPTHAEVLAAAQSAAAEQELPGGTSSTRMRGASGTVKP